MSVLSPDKPIASRALRLGLISFAIMAPLSLDIYLPAVPQMAEDLGAASEEATATLSVFFIGMAIGQLVIGPWSDRVGRKIPILAGLLALAIGSIICMLAPNIAVMLAGRSLQALGGAAVTVSGRASVRDVMDERQSARFFSTIATVNSLAPILAPSLGGVLLLIGGWRGIFGFLAMVALTLLMVTAPVLPKHERPPGPAAPRGTVFGTYGSLISNRRFLGLFLAVAANGACYFTYISLSPLVLMPYYGLSPQMFGLLIGLNGAALIIGAQINRRLLLKRSPLEVLRICSKAFFLLILPLFAWAFTYVGGLYVMLALVFATIAASSFVQSNGLALALSVSPDRTGAAAALLGAGLFGSGTIASLIGGFAFDGTPGSMILVMAAAMCLMLAALLLLVLPAAAESGSQVPHKDER